MKDISRTNIIITAIAWIFVLIGGFCMNSRASAHISFARTYPWSVISGTDDYGMAYKELRFAAEVVYREKKKKDGVLQEMWMNDVALALNNAHYSENGTTEVIDPGINPLSEERPCGGHKPCYQVR